SFCPYCQVWAFLAMRTPGLNPTSLGARSTCHGMVSCLYLTPGVPHGSCWDHFALPCTHQVVLTSAPRWALSYHCYADDTQLYLSFPPDETTVSARILDCLSDTVYQHG